MLIPDARFWMLDSRCAEFIEQQCSVRWLIVARNFVKYITRFLNPVYQYPESSIGCFWPTLCIRESSGGPALKNAIPSTPVTQRLI